MSELDRLVEYLETKNLNPKTIERHKANYRTITANLSTDIHKIPQMELKKLLDGNIKKLNSEEVITNPNTLHNLTSTILYVLQAHDKSDNRLQIYSKRLKVLKEGYKREQTEKVSDLGITAKYLRNKLSELYNKGKYLEYVINYLIINYNVRNEDLDLVITDEAPLIDDDENYLVVKPKSVMYIRNRYKTAKFHGQKVFIIKTPKFVMAVNNLNQKYLLQDKNGNRLAKGSIGTIITRKSIDNLGTTKINKIITSEATNNADEDKLVKISKRRGTHLDKLLDSYSYHEKHSVP